MEPQLLANIFMVENPGNFHRRDLSPQFSMLVITTSDVEFASHLH